MTLTFTVTPDPTNVPPRTMLEVEEDDTTRVLDSVAFFRDGVALRFEPILADRYAIAYDYDAPFDIEAIYRADVVEASTAADWSESWASTAAWTGSGWTAGGGVVSSATPAANIYRDVTTSTITKLEVTDPDNLTIELTDSTGTTVGSVTVLPTGSVVVAGNLGAAQSVAGSGSFTVTLTAGSMTVAGLLPAPWSATVALSTDSTLLPATRVRLVAPEVGVLAQSFAAGIVNGYKQGIAVDSAGNVYVSVVNANAVWKFNAAGTYLGFVGASVYGPPSSANGAFNTPQRIAVDASDNLFVVDAGNNRVQKFNSAGVYQSKFGTAGTGNGQFAIPLGIAINGSGDMWVVDNGNERVQKFNSAGVYQSQFGTLGTGNGQFGSSGASDVALDAGGNIYVTDYVNERVQKFDSSHVYQSQFGSAGAGNGQFSDVTGIQVDAAGNIYVVDQNPPDGGGPPVGRVQKFDSAYTYLGQFAVTGPSPMSKDAAGNLWLTDYYNNKVNKFAVGSGGSTDDIAVYVADNVISDSATQAATLSPTGDSAGAWLTNTVNPDLAVRLAADADHFILSSSRQTGSLKTSTVAIEIEGSSDYLTPTIGARRKETWQLDVGALSQDARVQMVSLLANDAPLNLRVPGTGYEGLDAGFYSVGDVEPERIGHPAYDHVTVFPLPFTPNRPPVFKPLNQWNMDALAQTGLTMDEVNAAFTSMNDLLVGP